MLVRFGTDSLGAEWPASVVCIGTFDGVHLGHQEVIRTAARAADEMDLPSVVLTFDRHPMATLAPEKCPPAVGTLSIDLRQFEDLGVSAAVVLQFDEQLAGTTAADFFDAILIRTLKTEHAVVGHDFAFGKGRQGTSEWLKGHIATTIVPPFELDGRRVSSSQVRQSILDGNVREAARLLGRPWELEGLVVAGQRLGRTLGFPTVNLVPAGPQVVPRDGVYAGFAKTPSGDFRAAVGIGVRPGIGDGSRTVEAYLLDYPGEKLYGASISMGFVDRLRDEQRFASLDELKEQIGRDVEVVRRTTA